MIKLPTLAEVCTAVKYSYEYSGIGGISILLKDGRAFTAWEDGDVTIPHAWDTPHNTTDIDKAIKSFVEYQKGGRYKAYKDLLELSKEKESVRVLVGRDISDLDHLEGQYGYSEIKKTLDLLNTQRGFSSEWSGILYREDELKLYGNWEEKFSQILEGGTPAHSGYLPQLLKDLHHNADVSGYPPVLVGKLKITYLDFKSRWLDN